MQNTRLRELAENWLPEATISMIGEAYNGGKLSAQEVVLMYLYRISKLDKELHSIIEINPDALQIAEALDAERRTTGPRGPLHGIPLLLKDNIDTGDKMHTSAGSKALAFHYAREDSFAVRQLREAGAVFIGKTNMTEWANFMSESMKNGYSSRGGQTKNPYGPGVFDTGGSSSGSGAAIAANLSAAAVGTETSGSILSPASSNSIVGIKPTVGLISRSGIIPISFSQDTAGPMARTVTDAAILLSVLSRHDQRDPVTLANPEPHRQYEYSLNRHGLTGMKIGIPRKQYFDVLDEPEAALAEAAIAILKEQGAIVVDSITIPFAEEHEDYQTLLYEFKPALNAYFHAAGHNVPVTSLQQVIAYNLAHPEDMLKYGQGILLESEELSGTLKEEEYFAAREKDLYLSREAGLLALFKDHQLDALLLPKERGCEIPAKAGYPSITVPAGYTPEGKPFGITFSGLSFQESKLISMAFSYEQATLLRRQPNL
ncbi:amidase [Bacillus lacus]|uniref:Amidase n=1 Tax=Metabacillus lacus TaxID=1983721 RepID=A0A7X2LZY5_9BACI|nr:amidase family protein [Metabacillus lacus]MRX72472.1 amidase [Metabacillus lacus]